MVTQKTSTKKHWARTVLYRGMQSRIAAALGVHRSLVSRVARGEKKSRRVKQALAKEIRRIENLLARQPEATE